MSLRDFSFPDQRFDWRSNKLFMCTKRGNGNECKVLSFLSRLNSRCPWMVRAIKICQYKGRKKTMRCGEWPSILETKAVANTTANIYIVVEFVNYYRLIYTYTYTQIVSYLISRNYMIFVSTLIHFKNILLSHIKHRLLYFLFTLFYKFFYLISFFLEKLCV